MVKIAASAAIRANIATLPRSGSSHSSCGAGSVVDIAFITLAPLLVLPIRIVRMLKVPERTETLYLWNRSEVINMRRRMRGPSDSPRIPRIVSSGFATKIRPDQVSQKHKDPGGLEENSDGHNEVPRVPAAPRLVG